MPEWVHTRGENPTRVIDAALDKIGSLVHERDTLLALIAVLEAKAMQRGDDPANVR